MTFNEPCANRLPCGLCMLMHSPCPYAVQKTEVTCSTVNAASDAANFLNALVDEAMKGNANG